MYTVREVGKSGGVEYPSFVTAFRAAIDWVRDTGIACELLCDHGSMHGPMTIRVARKV